MEYQIKIEIYKILIKKFKTPLYEAPEEMTAQYEKGDYVIIIGQDVWVTNHHLEEDTYSKAIYSPAFVRINPLIFGKVK